MKTTSIIQHCFARELRSYSTDTARWLNPMLFFLLVMLIFAISLGQHLVLLQQVSAPLIWVAVLLFTFLSAESIYQQDFQDGTLECYLLWPTPMSLIVLIKIMVQYLFTTLPMLVMMPVIAIFFDLSWPLTLQLAAALSLALLVLLPMVAVVAAVMLGHNSNALLAILLLPLFIPVLIFGNAWLEAANLGLNVLPYTAILMALACCSWAFCPLAAAYLIDLAVDN